MEGVALSFRRGPKDSRFPLQNHAAVSPDNKYTKLGQVVNTGARNEAEIKSETTLTDFGLLVTLQPEGDMPAGDIVITGYMTP